MSEDTFILRQTARQVKGGLGLNGSLKVPAGEAFWRHWILAISS